MISKKCNLEHSSKVYFELNEESCISFRKLLTIIDTRCVDEFTLLITNQTNGDNNFCKMISRMELLSDTLENSSYECVDRIDILIIMPNYETPKIKTFVNTFIQLLYRLGIWSASAESTRRMIDFRSHLKSYSTENLTCFLDSIWGDQEDEVNWEICWQEEQDLTTRDLLQRIDWKLDISAQIYQYLYFNSKLTKEIIWLMFEYLVYSDLDKAMLHPLYE
jgi:hypothetical protein